MYQYIEYILGMRFCKPVFHGMALRLLNICHRKGCLLGFLDESSSGPSDTRLGRWRMERRMGQGLVNMWVWVKNHRLLSILSIGHPIFWVPNFDIPIYETGVYPGKMVTDYPNLGYHICSQDYLEIISIHERKSRSQPTSMQRRHRVLNTAQIEL